MKNLTHVVPFPLKPGSDEVVWVEVEITGAPTDGAEIPVSSPSLRGVPTVSFQGALNQIKPAAAAIMETLSDLNNPEEIAVEFGVKLNAKAGAFFASLDGEATFKVTLKWKNPISRPVG